MPKKHPDLLPGTLEMLVLRVLQGGALHGYAMARWIQQASDEVLQVEEGSLYPALHRMEKRGWLQAEWGLSESNRRAKYYRLTRTGRARFKTQEAQWEGYTTAIGRVLSADPEGAQ
ncbi:MAG: PadR family transcriptional regulator [Planctomycetota bacterium]|nr:PadR family transcriptional regulator [Planctomycetota bacterium]